MINKVPIFFTKTIYIYRVLYIYIKYRKTNFFILFPTNYQHYTHKFKEFLKQRIIYCKCYKLIFKLKR